MLQLMLQLAQLLKFKEATSEVVSLVYLDNQYTTDINEPTRFNATTDSLENYGSVSVATKKFNLSWRQFADETAARLSLTGDYLQVIHHEAATNRLTLPLTTGGLTIFDFDVTRVKEYFPSDYTPRDYVRILFRKLITKLNAASNLIATEGRVGPAHFVLINPYYTTYKLLTSSR